MTWGPSDRFVTFVILDIAIVLETFVGVKDLLLVFSTAATAAALVDIVLCLISQDRVDCLKKRFDGFVRNNFDILYGV